MTRAPQAPHSADAARPETHGRITTLPDPRLAWDAARRARIAAVVFWGNLICQMGIILTGGTVRLTASGLGCSTWPNCEPGRFVPQLTLENGIHPLVEYGNRMLTGVLSVFAVLVLVVAMRWLSHKGGAFPLLAWLPLIGTLLQALIGAFVVWLHLHPGIVSPHFLISPILVAVSAVLVARLYEGDGPGRALVPRPVLVLFGVFAAVGLAVLVLGTLVTGTGPHSGDASAVTRLAFHPVTISRIHALAVWVFAALLVLLLVLLHRLGPAAARRAAWACLALTVVQGAIGYIQYALGLPQLLVFGHLIGAALFAGAITWVGTSLFTWRTVTAAGLAADEAALEVRA